MYFAVISYMKNWNYFSFIYLIRNLKVYQHNEEMERSIVLIFTDIVLFDFVYTQLIDSPLTLSLRYHSPAKFVCKALKGF